VKPIVVVGQSGSGKSRFSLLLGRKLGLSVIHADKIFWKPGWVDPDNDEYRAEIDGLTSGDAWIFDGIPGRVFDIILPRADVIIWLEQPPLKCMLRGYLRMIRYFGRIRPDMAEGCREKFTLRLWEYSARFETVQRPRIEEWIRTYAPFARVLRLRGDAGVARFLGDGDGVV
jgi:adenylate kinase family enzyme